MGELFSEKHVHADVTTENVFNYAKLQSVDGDISRRAAAVVEISLGDYFEKISRFAVGPRKTVYFLHDCLN